MGPYIREPIAIVGSGCRFPGEANTPSKLWELLQQPRDVSAPISSSRFNVDRFYHPQGTHYGTTNVKDAYFISGDPRQFDAPFFNILPSEADSMDPQHRMLLEVCYEASESAGITLANLQGSDTAVFIGLMCYDYCGIASRDPNFIPTYLASGTANSNAAARISYHFDCHGPSMTIDTACSSSLVAVHQAVQVLRDGVSRIAIAAGTNLILDSGNFITGSKMNMLSPTGHSRMWDVNADGYARGEGVGAVILKTLSSAIEDGDEIECIIRETGINQDGKTTGITMPSATAQAALIKSTYARAGLYLTEKSDRCQYFEAHGTGTPAGDPQEAQALSKAFFGYGNNDPEDILYVGSVKTIVGHTEGTAGIAGILKASLALKKAVIPPNLLLNRLNPDVAPFYTNMRILKEAQPWPEVPGNTPRRASVNSFGFGGTNAHAILESYQPPTTLSIESTASELPLIPFIFSAASDKSLEAVLKSYLSYLQENPSINLRRLAHTLSCRRSALPVKAAFSALTTPELCGSIEARLEPSSGGSKIAGIRSAQSSAILGVFTGQGAQWAGMGVKFITSYALARQTIEKLDQSLATLSVAERPEWKILEELEADKSSSRLGEAIFSQTLCTAVQIVLIDLLRSAGVVFKAVVGHSSGEIAAAYVAGFLSAHDAIRIAYYRGYYAKLASGPDGLAGSMLAVGTSFEDGKEMCELEDFEGRITVAACNSPESITISGDSDAIAEVQLVFEEEGKFTRPLKVSTAYHSHHMLLCSDSYIKSIQECKIQVLQPDENSPTWYSSVDGGARVEMGEALKASYWAENMVNPVLFAQAIECAIAECETFDIALEIGPHPALKGPVAQTIQQLRGEAVPYFGGLNRGKNDLKSFIDTLGSIWAHGGGSAVDFATFQTIHYHDKSHSIPLKGLPSYTWNHEREYWNESRGGKQYRTHETAIHEFLGRRTPDGVEDEWRWENVLKVRELPWLSGHALQGQTVFPATGYIALAMEAAMQIANGSPVRLIELNNLIISKAIAINDETGAEVVVSMSNITTLEDTLIKAKYTSYSSVSKGSGKMAVSASANVEIHLGEIATDVLPSPAKLDLVMTDVNVDDFYAGLSALGYGYTGDFRAMSNLTRRLGVASGIILRPSEDHSVSKLYFHPSMLDTALQGMFAAFSAPGDGRLWTLHAPTGMQRVSLVPSLCAENMAKPVSFDCTISAASPSNIAGDINVYSTDGRTTFIQIEGLVCRPFSPATQADDCHMFSETVWDVAFPDGDILLGNNRATGSQLRKAYDCERVALYYLRSLKESVTEPERAAIEIPPHHEALFDSTTHVTELVSSGKHTYAQKDWMSDTHEQICSIIDSYGSDADFNIMRAVGENLPAVVRGETTILEHMTKDDKLDDYYQNALGFEHAYDVLTGMVAQLVHRHPHMDILEIGAGTGGATAPILSEIGAAFSSYTFTDIGVGFLSRAQESFKDYSGKMIFKALNIEKDPVTQGFTEHAYDVVLAANVLHATRTLDETLKNARKLLRPGGYLILLEIVDNMPMRVGLVMGGLPGWWVGREDGRRYAPTIELPRWNKLLKKAGFSGIDTFTPLDDPLVYLASVFVSQAVDESMNTLRRPLSSKLDQISIPNLLLIGGNTMETSRLIEDVEDLLRPRTQQIITATTLDELQDVEVPPMCTVLSLTEIDGSMFKNMSKECWQVLKNVFMAARNVLWLTRGYRREDPYAAMTVGFMRCITYELPQLRHQLLDIDQSKVINGTLLAEMLLRLHIAEELEAVDYDGNLLWTTETEIIVENEKFIIPRIKPQVEQNKRYNSAKRPITKLSDLSSSLVSLEWFDTQYVLREDSSLFRHNPNTHTLIDVNASLLYALRVPAGRMFFSLGVDKQAGTKVLSASLLNASTISIPKAWSIPIHLPDGFEAQYLSSIVAYAFTQYLLTTMSIGDVLLVHEPSPALASVLSTTKFRVIYTTSKVDGNKDCFYIHPQSSNRAIQSIIPKNVSLFLDLSSDSESGLESTQSVVSKISAALPKLCQRGNTSMFLSKDSFVRAAHSDCDVLISSTLQSANSFASSLFSSAFTMDLTPLPMVSLNETVGVDQNHSFSVVNWRSNKQVSTLIETVDARKDIFQEDKTYWLVGLAGDLGQSICDWMADHGARNIVLMSRTRRVEDNWISKHKANGVTISWLAGDVTSRNDLRKVYQEICLSFPAIAGVANGALVLRDQAFSDMDLETFQTVIKPKIDGTVFLSELFKENTLDFFIAFSSVVATMGNSGQSAYSAANSFTKALVNQRRERGLAGSVIDISRVAGVGYVEREVKTSVMSEKQLKRLMNVSLPMSEPDLHQLFAEAIISGRPDSGLKSELISGIRTLTVDNDNRVYWAAQVKFSHFIQNREHVGDEKGNKAARIPVRTLLQAAKSPEDVVKILRTAFITKLNSSLNLSSDDSIDENMPLIELGLDSLVAVDVRTWFLQELKIDLPVLKILGGASAVDLVALAVERLPQNILPKFGETLTHDSKTISKDHSTTTIISRSQPPQPSSDEKSPSNSIVPPAAPRPTASSTTVTPSFRSSPPSSTTTAEVDLPTPPSEPEIKIPQDKVLESNETSISESEILRTEPMSYGQSSFWFLGQYLEDPTTFNITFWVKVKGSIDAPRLKRAVELVAQSHESLRTSFSTNEDGPCQKIMRTSAFQLKQQPVKSQTEFMEVFKSVENHVYDIENGDTIRLILCEESADTFYLVLGFHHIVMDGMSSDVLFANLQQAYKNDAFPSTQLQYSTWAARQRSFVESPESSEDRSFWKSEFATLPPVLPLFPMSQLSSRKILKRYHMIRASINLGADMTTRIKDRCRSQKLSPAYFHLAVWKTLLFRFLNTDDICIGVNDMNRTDAKDAGVIGNLMNILPVRFKYNPTQNFLHAIKEARGKVMAAVGHSKVPFSVILGDLNIARDPTHSPVFQTSFDYRETFKISFLDHEAYSPPEGLSRNSNAYDVSLGALESLDGESTIYVGAQSSLYSKEDAEIILKTYVHLLETFTEHPATRISRPSLFTKSDIAQGLALGTGAPLATTWPETLLHRIDEMVESYGDSTAIKDGCGNVLTYTQMDLRIQSIAASLRQIEVVEDSRVAVFQEPAVDWICSMLAIMRVGAVYIPLDYRNSLPRLAGIVKACQPTAVLVDSTTSDDAKHLNLENSSVINTSSLETSNPLNIPVRAKAETAGIILFTSGTTGVPKGIMLKHSSLRNSIEALTTVYGIEKEIVLQQTAFSFDMSIDEIFVALCNGGTLFIVDKARHGDSRALMKIIQSEGITYTRATPPEYLSWIRHGADYVANNRTWKHAFAGGDRLTVSLRRGFRELGLPSLKLFNSYGPTEITLSAVKIQIDYQNNISSEENIPMGKLMPGYSIYILDDNLNPVAPDVPGEIVIGGAGVSLGYLNETLSNEKFLNNPWASPEFIKNGWTKMYRTGDRGSINPDGHVLFHGRIEGDLQVKLRGIRIELEDIENSILRASKGAFTDVICTVHGDPEFVVAHATFSPSFVTDDDSRNLFIKELLAHLPLPSYMIPAVIIPLKNMPLTVHLKRDRAAIAALPVSQSSASEDEVLDLNAMESELKGMWMEVLPSEMSQGVYSRSADFFRFGGSSLLMVELQSKIRTRFGVNLSHQDLFQASTLGDMTKRIERGMGNV